MERHRNGICIRTTQDPSHFGLYQIELEAEIPSDLQPDRKVLESYGFVPVDFDQWGLAYLSTNDPDLSAEVDEVDDYGDNSRLILRKGRLSEYDIDETKLYLEQLYRQLTSKTVKHLTDITV
jgi:hypothetical protein